MIEVNPAMTRIAIYDTTLRDGSQGEGVNFSLQDKLRITERLDDLGVDYIEGGYPLSNPKDEAFFRAVRDLDLKHARVAAFGMTRRRDIAAEDDAGMRALVGSGASGRYGGRQELGLPGDGSPRRLARRELPDDRRLGRLLRQPRSTRSSTTPSTSSTASAGTPTTPSRPWPPPSPPARAGWSSATPTAVACPKRWPRPSIRWAGPSRSRSGSTPTTTASWPWPTPWPPSAGGRPRSRGRSTGSASGAATSTSARVVANLALKFEGYDLLRPGSLARLTEVSRFVYETANMNFRPGQPFVGSSAFAHKGGMHVHGIRKAASSYEHIDPVLVGNERRVLVSELSGKSNIAEKLGEHRPRTGSRPPRQGPRPGPGAGKRGVPVRGGRGVVRAPGREGWPAATALGSTGSATGSAWRARPRRRPSPRPRSNSAWATRSSTPWARATARSMRSTSPSGKAWSRTSPGSGRCGWSTSRSGSSTTARAPPPGSGWSIESQDGDEVWGTVGVSENMIEASWMALLDAFDHKLAKDARAASRPTMAQIHA